MTITMAPEATYPVELDSARSDAADPVELRVEDVAETVVTGEPSDVVFVRLLLSRLAGAPDWVAALDRLVASGEVVVLEHVRISGAFASPASTVLDPSLEIY